MGGSRDDDDAEDQGLQPLWSLFDARTVQRGLGVYAEGLVEQVQTAGDAGEMTLTGRVQGHQLYKTTVRIRDFTCEQPPALASGFESSCSCPVGWACKHAVAVLASWMEDQGIPAEAGQMPDLERPKPTPVRSPDPPPASAPSWLPPALAPRLAQDQAGLELYAPGLDQGLPVAYLLQHDSSNSGLQRFLPVAVRWLDHSRRWGVAKRADDAGSMLQRLAGSLSSGDQLLVTRLARLVLDQHHGQNYHWRGDGWLHVHAGATGELVERVLASGRAYAGDLGGDALRRGPERPGRITWLPGKDGRVRLRAVDKAGAPFTLLPLDPPWYRDGSTIGPLHLDGLVPEIIPLLDAPAVAPAVATTAVISWRARGVVLPEPPGGAQADPATPVLLVAPAEWPSVWSKGAVRPGWQLEVAVPMVRYGTGDRGQALIPLGDTQLRLGSHGTPVIRDLPAEERWRADLVALGLACTSSGGPRISTRSSHVGELPVWHHPTQAQRPDGDAPAALPATVLAGLHLRGWEISGSVPTVQAVNAQSWTMRIADAPERDWFELHLGIEIGGQPLDLVPVLLPLIERGEAAWQSLPQLPGAAEPTLLLDAGPGRALAVPAALLSRLRAALLDIATRARGPGGGLRLDRADLAAVAGGALGSWSGSERVQRMAEALHACLQPVAVAAPTDFGLPLRDYQCCGLGWMLRLRALQAGGLLADDMGLGKTVQVLALIAHDRAAGALDLPTLIVCPASVVGVWEREARRCVPGLPVHVHHGLERDRSPSFPAGSLVLTTYATLARDAQTLTPIAWHLVVCDEAQAMKNAGTRSAGAVRGLDARHRLCLTGTPVENHLGELHSYLDWLVPGLLGTRASFNRGVRQAVEGGGDHAAERLAWLRRRIAPFLLRRTKTAVAAELPPRTEVELPITLGPEQRAAYEAVRLAMDARVQSALAQKGLAGSQLDVLEALLALRQVCCDPRLARMRQGAAAGSAKLETLTDLLPSLIEDGRRILLFSSFTSFLDLIEREVVAPLGVPCLRLDGQTPTEQRPALVERFQAGEVPLFLLSLKAGGTGLTLTAADTVLICDPWWNPATEAQAADRAHRIGQDKPVTIYRLVCSGTVEERIRTLQARKTDLAAALHGEDGQSLGRLDATDVAALLAPMD